VIKMMIKIRALMEFKNIFTITIRALKRRTGN
jgi:hypothetical protein